MKILSVVGTRPQFVKAATLTRAIAADERLCEVMLHTGQHFDSDMSDVFFQELAIPEPNYDLGIHGGTHGNMTGRMLAAIEDVLIEVRPCAVVVYGDTNSALAGALAAAKLLIPVAHVEAGLRSFNRCMPEETNRVIVDHISQLLFCPTTTADSNLKAEGIVRGVHYVGDVMYDAALFAGEAVKKSSRVRNELGLEDGQYQLATVHRAENTDDPGRLAQVLEYLRKCAEESPIVFPVHPRTRMAIERSGLSINGLIARPPVGYLDMARLLLGAAAVFTDSGGLQKEAYFYRVPCVTLREETEWVETIEAGWNRLWTTPDYSNRREISDYGDGHAANKILELIIGELPTAMP